MVLRSKRQHDLAITALAKRWGAATKDMRKAKYLIGIFGLLFGVSVAIGLFGHTYLLGARLFGLGAVLFLPGWLFSLIVFPYDVSSKVRSRTKAWRSSLDPIERLAVSIIFSILITSLLVFVLHVVTWLPPVGYKLIPRNLIYLMTLSVLILGVLALWRQRIASWFVVIGVLLTPVVIFGLHTMFNLPYLPQYVGFEVAMMLFGISSVGFAALSRRG